MSLITNETLLERLKKAAHNNHVRLPGGIELSMDDESGVLTLGLGDEALGLRGAVKMQEDPNAFESWALIFRTYLKPNTVLLTRRSDAALPLRSGGEVFHGEDWNSEHYMRFLFRVMKFKENYGWFRVGEDLAGPVAEFERFYAGNKFQLNQKGADSRTRGARESRVEAYFENHPALLPGFPEGTHLSRQLKVGVFLKDGLYEDRDVHDENRVMPGGGAAIDLWTQNGDTLTVFELKAKDDKAGIISELMFYCGLVKDAFVDGERFDHSGPLVEGSGLDVLAAAHPARVQGVMLTDKLHSLITPAVLEEMNKNKSGILYRGILYDCPDFSAGVVTDAREVK